VGTGRADDSEYGMVSLSTCGNEVVSTIYIGLSPSRTWIVPGYISKAFNRQKHYSYFSNRTTFFLC